MEQFGRKSVEISPDYLLALSKNVEIVSKHYQNERLGTLTQDFSNTLTTNFTQLSQLLALYQQDKVMKSHCLLRCKIALELYCFEKIVVLIRRDKKELAQVSQKLLGQFREHVNQFEALIFSQRVAKEDFLNSEKDKIIFGLRRQVGVKRQYTQQLQQRVHELQDENSKLYSKLIANAKKSVDYAINSPSKLKQMLGTHPLPITDRSSSPRKRQSTRSYEQQIYQIMQCKLKQQSIQQRHTSLDEYLKVYFAMKYGKPIAQQNEVGFRQVISHLARNQQKNIFVLFEAIIEEQCEESYFSQYRLIYQRVVKCIKRYLHQKYGKSLYQLDKVFDSKNLDEKSDVQISENDLQPILVNIYRSSEVNTLELILNELLSSKPATNGKLSCKKLINEILNYELKKHLMRIEDITREINRLVDRVDKTVTFEQMQKVLVKLVKDRKRCEQLKEEDYVAKKLTISQAIEVIERIRRAKIRKD